jgi:ATP-binding cassette subfamily B protein
VLAASTFARFYCVSWLGERVVAAVRSAVYDRVIGLSPAYFETARTGEILSRLTTDTEQIQSVVGSSASLALRNFLLLIGGTALLFVTSVKLALLILLIVPLVVVPILVFGRRVRRLSRASQDRIADVSAYASETLNAVETVQAFAHEAHDRRRFGAAVEEAFVAAVRRINARAWLTALVILLIFGAVDAVMWIGARDVAQARISGGTLAAFVFYAIVVAGSAGALSEVYGDFQRAAGAAERLVELLRTPIEIRAPAHPTPLALPARGAIAFERVGFRYPSRPEADALSDFDLGIAPGERVALVGPSGAGKSTVFRLLLRFHDPEAGRITFDGVPLPDLDPQVLRGAIGVVAQDPAIFAATAIENIRYGRPEASDDEVEAAAEAAQAAGFIARLPEGFHTFLGERGVRLSGGQRQRIAIARAILRNPALLLLDEATSALDSESEHKVQAALEPLMRGRTTLVIAHRLATVLGADRIVVIDSGRIVAQGKHDQLMAAGGLYTRLATLQFNVGQLALGRAAQ